MCLKDKEQTKLSGEILRLRKEFVEFTRGDSNERLHELIAQLATSEREHEAAKYTIHVTRKRADKLKTKLAEADQVINIHSGQGWVQFPLSNYNSDNSKTSNSRNFEEFQFWVI